MSLPVFCQGMHRETGLYRAVEEHLLSRYPDVCVKHDQTQTAFIRSVQFAWVSLPRRKADAGAILLSISAPGKIVSPRILHAAQVSPGRWMHHMLLRSAEELDEEVLLWLEQAWALIGPGRRKHQEAP